MDCYQREGYREDRRPPREPLANGGIEIRAGRPRSSTSNYSVILIRHGRPAREPSRQLVAVPAEGRLSRVRSGAT